MRKKCYMLSIAALLLAACSSSEDTTLNQEPLSQDYIMLRPMTTGATRGTVITATNFREFFVRTSAVPPASLRQAKRGDTIDVWLQSREVYPYLLPILA